MVTTASFHSQTVRAKAEIDMDMEVALPLKLLTLFALLALLPPHILLTLLISFRLLAC